VARLSTLAVGVFAILLGLLAEGINVAVPVILAISIAASANFPVIVISIFWRFNTSGVICGMAAGLCSSVTFALLGPAVEGPGAAFPIVNPAILSVPIGFIGAVIGTFVVRRNPSDDTHFDKVLFQAQTGLRVGELGALGPSFEYPQERTRL
jgi:cation/acetate symporter